MFWGVTATEAAIRSSHEETHTYGARGRCRGGHCTRCSGVTRLGVTNPLRAGDPVPLHLHHHWRPGPRHRHHQLPAGYRLVGSGGGHAQFGAEAPTADLSGATISAAVIDASPNNFAYIVIYCEPSAQFTDVVTVEVRDHSVRAGSFSSGIARCPAGYYAFGGGGYFGPSFMSAAYSNASNGPGAAFDSWTFSGVTPSGANTMVTTTQCAPKIGRNFVAQFGNVSTSNNQFTSSYVNRPSGWTAIAGGFYASNPNGTEAFPSSVVWSVPASNGSWYASGATNPGNKIVALAQCVI